jgi:hypothetical protein
MSCVTALISIGAAGRNTGREPIGMGFDGVLPHQGAEGFLAHGRRSDGMEAGERLAVMASLAHAGDAGEDGVPQHVARLPIGACA